ncbi:MAG TPA: hypothetical protein VFJ96_04950 [Gemmatimonadaceae bacterium]|nr:hypothetical protein [Gemmatimonadaceae bacterium]
MVASPSDGRLKLHVIRRALLTRRTHAELFRAGAYVPLHAEGWAADHVLAFARTMGDLASLTIAPRRTLALARDNGLPLGSAAWGDAAIRLPPALARARWECALTGRPVEPSVDGANFLLRFAQVFHTLPVALLVAVA